MQTKNRSSTVLLVPILPILLLISMSFTAVTTLLLLSQRFIIVVGPSHVIISSGFSLFALFIALGIWRGLSLQNKIIYYLKRNLLFLSVISGIGLSAFFLTSFFYMLTQQLSVNFLLVFHVYLLCVLAPMAFLIGENITLVNALFDPLLKTNSIDASTQTQALIWTAVGCFIAMIVSTVAVDVIGMAWTIILLVILLILMVLSLVKDYLQEIVTISVGLGILVISTAVNFEIQTFPLQISVYMPNFLQGESISSDSHYPSAPTVSSLMQKILFDDLHLQHRNILVLTDTLFNLDTVDDNHNHFVYVSHHVNDKLSACNYLDLLVRGNKTFNDASTKPIHIRKIYDVIVADLPLQKDLPLQDSDISKIHQALAVNGYALFNVIAKPTFTDDYSKKLDSMIHSVFDGCLEIPVKYGEQPTNIIYVCKKKG